MTCTPVILATSERSIARTFVPPHCSTSFAPASLGHAAPMASLSASCRPGASLANHARRAWSVKRSIDTHVETSHAFVLPALLQVKGKTLYERSHAWAECLQVWAAQLATIQTEIDRLCFTLYGISETDQRAI